MTSLKIANNNIFASFSRIDLEEDEEDEHDEIMYENNIQVYNFNGDQINFRVDADEISIVAADCSNDGRVYTYLSSYNNISIQLNTIIENLNGNYVEQNIYETAYYNTDNFGGKLVISKNGRLIVCIINNILHIWNLDITEDILRFDNFRILTMLQRIVLNDPVNTFCITDDMKILCARLTPGGNDIMIFENIGGGQYANIPVIPNLNINIDYFANRYTNIKSISYSSQMLFNIARTEDRDKRTHKNKFTPTLYDINKREHKNKFTPTLENIKTRMRDGRRSKSRRRRSNSGRKKRSKSVRRRSNSGRKKRSKSVRKRSKSVRRRSKPGRRRSKSVRRRSKSGRRRSKSVRKKRSN
jgi:hypothetical protein